MDSLIVQPQAHHKGVFKAGSVNNEVSTPIVAKGNRVPVKYDEKMKQCFGSKLVEWLAFTANKKILKAKLFWFFGPVG